MDIMETCWINSICEVDNFDQPIAWHYFSSFFFHLIQGPCLIFLSTLRAFTTREFSLIKHILKFILVCILNIFTEVTHMVKHQIGLKHLWMTIPLPITYTASIPEHKMTKHHPCHLSLFFFTIVYNVFLNTLLFCYLWVNEFYKLPIDFLLW